MTINDLLDRTRAPVLPFTALRCAGLWRVRIGAAVGTHTTFLGAYRRARWGL